MMCYSEPPVLLVFQAWFIWIVSCLPLFAALLIVGFVLGALDSTYRALKKWLVNKFKAKPL